MKFESKKDRLFSLIILGINAFLIGITIIGIVSGEIGKGKSITLILMLGVVGLLFWLYFLCKNLSFVPNNTNYKFTSGKSKKFFHCVFVKFTANKFYVLLGTNYELSAENGLIYRSGPINGKISVDPITEIIKGKTLWVGLKPATARKGLTVKYDKNNEIYISTKTNELFIEKILELNGKIKISE